MTIAEVSREYGISIDTLRYYERIGLLPPVNRSKSGFRDYTRENCEWVEFIKCMRTAGIPVEALVNYVELFQQGDTTREARKQILVEQRDLLQARVDEMTGTLKLLTGKIQSYDQWNPGAEERLLPKHPAP
ncbi:MAG: MerR family transcriptional regulator [Angelakisella sp.]|jgi:DNA-binding transcriptional MerR regulator|nr:MerR family transcriptional regulator [Angelakisella sp.]